MVQVDAQANGLWYKEETQANSLWYKWMYRLTVYAHRLTVSYGTSVIV